ncbi:Stc1 domain containing protein [Pyrenophora teres f. maculata]|nr:Stc1 domain containing protein [Pyrenophora teres f. maculata]
MPSRRQQAHVYKQDEIDKLKGISLPPKIKCGVCLKNLPQVKFSTKQLTDARWQVQTAGKMIKRINCQDCVGKPVVEIECSMCGKTKGIAAFARVQRRKTDTAKCFPCIDMQLAENAFEEDKYEDPGRAFITPDHSNGLIPEYFSSATSSTASAYADDDWRSVNEGSRRRKELEDNSARRPQRERLEDGGIALSTDFQRAMSVSGSADDSLIGTEYAYPAGGNGDGDFSEPRTKSWHTKSIEVSSASSGFNPNAYGRQSTPSIAGSSQSFASSVAERSDTTEIRSNGWAKIRAAPRAPVVDAWHSDDDEEQARDDDSDEDSDDDDDDDDDPII